MDENSSRSNQKEADLTMALGNYLVQQGYSADEVTILAAYSGQAYYMRKVSHKTIFCYHFAGNYITTNRCNAVSVRTISYDLTYKFCEIVSDAALE